MTERDDKRNGAETDPPPTEEELHEAASLRDALERDASSVELASALRAAWAPEPLDRGEHAELLADLPSAEEAALAAELRDALAGGTGGHVPEIVGALRSAWAPRPLADDEHAAIVRGAIGAKTATVVAFRRRANALRFVTGAATAALALAASVVVWMTGAPPSEQAVAPAFAKARSTQSLFDEPFRAGETSARIDKIALARASDYRDNRFAKWGVK
jgi:hypothetical protein